MRLAKDAIARHIHGVSGHVVDAVQEGIGLLHDLIPDANVTSDAGPQEEMP